MADGVVYVSGTLPFDKDNNVVHVGDAAAQTRHVLETIKGVVEAAGGSMHDVTFNMIMLTDWANYAKVNEVYAEYFPGEARALLHSMRAGKARCADRDRQHRPRRPIAPTRAGQPARRRPAGRPRGGSDMHYELHGRMEPDAPTLVLSSGLGGAAFWTPQLPALTQDYRVLVYDQLGTNRSPANLPAGYSIESMAVELLELLDTLGIRRCHFIGHALGGLIGLQIALLRPQLLQSLVPINAWSSPNPHSARCFAVRLKLLHDSGPAAYVQAQSLFLYPADWIAANSERLARDDAHALAHFPPTMNLVRRIEALLAFDIEAELPRITTPTLLIANRDDMLVPWQRSQHLADNMPNAQLALLNYGGHASSVSDSEPFNQILLDHLAEQCGQVAAA